MGLSSVPGASTRLKLTEIVDSPGLPALGDVHERTAAATRSPSSAGSHALPIRGADADWLPSRVWYDAAQVIASAIAICPSKPRDVAINR